MININYLRVLYLFVQASYFACMTVASATLLNYSGATLKWAHGEYIIASVRCLGLSAFRIILILSSLRILKTVEIPPNSSAQMRISLQTLPSATP